MINNDHSHAPNTPALGAHTTAVAVVLDETGSMQFCRDAAISGFNEWLGSQQKAEGACALTVVQFSDRGDAPMCRLLYDGVPIREARPLDHQTYRPDGNTPLYDAVARTIAAMDQLAPTPDRILVVILTDGDENASREHTQRQIQDMIRAREATGRWTFVYLGANQDAWAASREMGMQPGNSAPFTTREIGPAFTAVAEATVAFRQSTERSSRDFWRRRRPSAGPTASR